MARRNSNTFDYRFPFHVCAHAINREWFELPMPEVWRLMSYHLHFIRHAFDVEIFAFVLMTNHFHLLLRTPAGNLSAAMGYFLRETSRDLARASRRINQSYGGRFLRTNIIDTNHFLNAYKYVYRNPVHAGLAGRVEDYPWSTLRGILGRDHLLVPVVHDSTLFGDLEGTLRWLNTPVANEDWESVKKALKRRTFQLPKQGAARQPNRLESQWI